MYDGETAVKYAEAGTYDAIVVDIMMPKLDGLQVVKTLRAHGCDTPVMILTAKSELEDKVEGLDSGAERLYDQAVYDVGISCEFAHSLAAARP